MTHATNETKVLVVDDSPATVEVMRRYLTSAGFVVHTAASVDDAIGVLDQTPVDLVITDLKMPRASGLDLVHHVNENYHDTQILMVTGYPSIETAVEAVKGGAEDYLAKPFTEEELLAAVGRALEGLRIRRAGQPSEGELDKSPSGIIGESEAMRAVFRLIRKAAASTATVLISGESGTGKELVARDIHYLGPRAAEPFVPVNCGGIPETLLESELFGHVKGAFTGALETRAGFFQTAEGGTIFLDEISETTPAMQVKLLRALNDREVCMVGATRTQRVDVRIAAATNKDLAGLVRTGQFREDLYFRLNVIPIRLPPLRERGDDILLLIRRFAAHYAAQSGRATPEFSARALASLRGYPWPGNVRELQNVVQRLVVMNEGDTIEVADLPDLMRFSALRSSGLDRTLADVEAEHIRRVLESVGGNKTRAAGILGIDRKTLREKLKHHGLDATGPR
ncbi:MAG: sigma-54 dependent transcriptional regulator [Phycisphaerae bacterium]|nr:sigma-54 dependent transcriptional regulator [Phycisphaerae bacterium]